jgi:UDP-glucose 4-epimerase
MEKVFLTGVTGFIGSELAKKLSEEYEVYGLVRTTSNKSSLDPIKDILNKIEIKYGNLTDFAAVKKIIKDISPHYIIHVGAATAVRHSFDNPLEFQETNHEATVNLIHAALELPEFKKFIFASTMETYGEQKESVPFKENLKLNPISPYAVSKVASDYYIRMAGEAFGLPYIISRACNTFGRKTNNGFIVEYLVTQMLKNEPVYLGSPDAIRDLMFAEDHVNAYVTALKSDIKNEVFNFSTGSATTMKDLALKIKELTGYQKEINFSFPPDYPSRPIVDSYLSLDASKARNLLSWEPKVSIEEGLKKTIDFWKKKLNL